ncbi:Arabinose-binding domain of AraC transcription regulator, N-term [Actinoplanes cyaneus]|nr:Arabinose-binding domain of AraC transcription regulator, N-term [Actinoplanes cyaneus]
MNVVGDVVTVVSEDVRRGHSGTRDRSGQYPGPATTTVTSQLAELAEFSVVADPCGARQVVGLRLPDDVPQPGPALLVLHHGLRRLRGDYGPRSVHLPGTAPGGTHGYSEAFGAKVRFGSRSAVLRVPAGVLSGQAERSGLAWRVRNALSDRLGVRSTALADVARVIALQPRTIQRALADEGLSFAEILDCVRRERAHCLLTGTELPLSVIATHLDFAEPAVLSRCVRRWWGHTAATHRRQIHEVTPRPPASGHQ